MKPAPMHIMQCGPGEATVLCPLPADYPGFLGHFPGDPILPGMCHVLLCCEAAARLLHGNLVLTEVRRARFRRKVRPGEELAIRLRWMPLDGGGVEIRAVHSIGDEDAADLHLVFSATVPGDARPQA